MASRPGKQSSRVSEAAPAEPVDRVATLLDHADDVGDVIQFREENAASGRWDYLEQFDVPTVKALGLEEFIQQRYGGGKYRAAIRNRQTSKYTHSAVVSVSGPRKAEHERSAQRPASPAATAPAASSTNGNPPGWIEKIILPIGVTMATAFGSLLAKKLLETPAPDPLLVELVKRNKPTAGDGFNPLELMKMVGDAEERGERRGREVGRLAARADGGGGSGVGSAIHDALPLVERLIDAHERQTGAPPPLANAQLPTPSPAADETPATDIIPAWIRPYVRYKMFILEAADAPELDAEPIADMVIRNSNEATWAAIVDADAAGRLESDIFAAIPALLTTDNRKKFVAAIVAELHEAIHAPDEDETPEAVNDA